MIKTQIQLPERLYRDLKRLAVAQEWSLAETLRRGAEFLLQLHPSQPLTAHPWSPPRARQLGWRGLTHEQVHAAALDDMESTPPVPRRR
jgi:hypothetical protein